jgi:hypothetical protein
MFTVKVLLFKVTFPTTKEYVGAGFGVWLQATTAGYTGSLANIVTPLPTLRLAIAPPKYIDEIVYG